MASICRVSLRGPLGWSSRAKVLSASSYLVRHLSSSTPCEDVEEHHEEAPSSASDQEGNHHFVSQIQEGGRHSRPSQRSAGILYLDDLLGHEGLSTGADHLPEEARSQGRFSQRSVGIHRLGEMSEEAAGPKRVSQAPRASVHLDDLSEETPRHERPSKGASGITHLDELSEEAPRHERPSKGAGGITHLDDLSEEAPRYERPSKGAGGITHLDDLSASGHRVQSNWEDDEDMGWSREAAADSSEGSEENETFLLLTNELERACDEANLTSAYEIVEKMAALSLTPRPYLVRSVMKLCIRDGRWDLALDMVGHKEWAVSDVRLHHMAIMACRRGARWEEALSVVESMKTKRLERDGAVYASAISVCGVAGQWAKGVQLLEEAVADWPYALTPNMFNAAISTCGRGEAWEMVTRVVGLMEQHGVAWDSYTYSALMDAYAKSGRPDEALQLFDKMADQGVQADRVAYTVAMSVYVRQGQFDKVLQLFKRMREEGLEPDGHTYAAAITACSGSANVDKEVMGLLADYRRSRHRPNRLVYVAAAATCAREGHWKGAMRVLEQMVEAKVLPEFWTFAAATEACTNRGVWTETLEMLQASSSRGRFVSREEYEEVMQRAAGAARERCGSSAQLSQDLVATQALQAEEKDLWTAVIGCQNKNRWRRLVTLVERLQEAGKAEAVVSKGKKRGRAAMAKGLAVQLPHALVLTGVRLGLLREALELFNALEKVAEPLGEEGAAEREMVHRVLVRGLLQHKDGWALPLEALRDELEAPQVKRKPRGGGAKRGGDKPGRGLEAYKLAVELCSRARQWQALEAVLELYHSRHGSDAALVDVAKAVVEEMGILGANKPQEAQVGGPSKKDHWGVGERGHLDDMSEASPRYERPSRGPSGFVHLDDLSDDTRRHGLKTRSNNIIRLDDLSDETPGREMTQSNSIIRLDDLSDETPGREMTQSNSIIRLDDLSDETPGGEMTQSNSIIRLDDLSDEPSSDGERQDKEATEVVGQRELQ